MKELTVFSRSLEDYFTYDMLKILIVPLLGSALVLYILFFSMASSGFDGLQNMQVEINQHETIVQNGEVVHNNIQESYSGSGIIDFLLKYTVTSWIVSFLVYTVGIFAIGYLSIFISLLIVGFLTPKILGIVHNRHYQSLEVDLGYGTIIGGVTKLIKSALIMIILFIVLIPFYFIPLVNIVAINIPFFISFIKCYTMILAQVF